jgi:hypothetical protein
LFHDDVSEPERLEEVVLEFLAFLVVRARPAGP